MSELTDRDRNELVRLGRAVLEALQRYHRGLTRLEIECFFLPPRAEGSDLFPDGTTVEPDGDEAIVTAHPWQLRCRRGLEGAWEVASAGRACAECEGKGTCARCVDPAQPSPECGCLGLGMCPACQGIGKSVYF